MPGNVDDAGGDVGSVSVDLGTLAGDGGDAEDHVVSRMERPGSQVAWLGAARDHPGAMTDDLGSFLDDQGSQMEAYCYLPMSCGTVTDDLVTELDDSGRPTDDSGSALDDSGSPPISTGSALKRPGSVTERLGSALEPQKTLKNGKKPGFDRLGHSKLRFLRSLLCHLPVWTDFQKPD